MTQADALNLLKTGRNVFVTGPAGSGKTHVINEYIRYLKSHEVPVGITASTGIAATHMGGVTIHSWSGMGISDSFSDAAIEAIGDKAYIANRIRDTKVLIIDEVSMLHHFRLDNLNSILKHICKNDQPFGGLQVVLCGDFFQLPPVSRFGSADTHFIYRSEAWNEGKFTICYLSENYRQKEDGLLSILNEIRSGEVSEAAYENLKSRYVVAELGARSSVPVSGSADPAPASRRLRDSESSLGTTPNSATICRLYTHNVNVDEVNETELAKVDAPEITYEMRTKGKKPLVEALKKSCLAPERLRLRKGSRVMCVKNNFDKGYVNGTLGVVISCGPDVDPVIHTLPTAEFPKGRDVTIEQATWKIEDDGKILAELDQYPLRLAWAITVHKSQGMSLDAVEVDLSRCFEPGMGYVALSRVRTLAGLTILGMNEAALMVHPEVLEYDRHLQELSRKAENVLAATSEKELKQNQDEFLARVAPLHKMQKGEGRRKKVSTTAQTAELLARKKSLKDIAKARDITVETVISHLEELVKEGADVDLKYLKYEISPQHFGKIEQALIEVAEKQKDGKPPMLSPVKNKVPLNVTFKEIRLARVLLGYFV